MPRSRIDSALNVGNNGVPGLQLELRITDPLILPYLARFTDEERPAQALTALKIGVLCLQQAPFLSEVVQEKFAAFEKELGDQFTAYLGERNGALPKSLDRFFGDNGIIAGLLAKHFDPTDGRVAKLIENQVGPNSKFARALDPTNKTGILALIEKMIESKIDQLMGEFSLDEKDSAVSRLKEMFAGWMVKIEHRLGLKEGRKEEESRGHVKGLSFQADLYQVVAKLARELDDMPDFVANNAVRNGKVGDHLITLGQTSGAPDLKIVVEVKDREFSLGKARQELANAKENRRAAIGILVWAKGCEPAGVRDFDMIDGDFYCTADKEDLEAGRRLLFLEAAYKVARMTAVLKARKEAGGKFNAAHVQEQIEAVVKEIGSLPRMAKKLGSMKKHVEELEEDLLKMHEKLDSRLNQVLGLLGLDEAA
jgi:hypothetical protein